jgi:hypothetical protein
VPLTIHGQHPLYAGAVWEGKEMMTEAVSLSRVYILLSGEKGWPQRQAGPWDSEADIGQPSDGVPRETKLSTVHLSLGLARWVLHTSIPLPVTDEPMEISEGLRPLIFPWLFILPVQLTTTHEIVWPAW